MKKICLSILVVICLVLSVWYFWDSAEKDSPVITRYTLTYLAGNHGTIDGASTQIVAPGEAASPVVAVPDENYHFVGWSDGLATARRLNPKVTAGQLVTANFAINQNRLTYAATEHGSIDGVSSQVVDFGASGSEVTAVPAAGYHFVAWSDGVTTASRTDTEVKTDLELTASFELSQYTLSYSAAENGIISGRSEQVVNLGVSASPVTALPAKHYHFTGWSDGLGSATRTDADVQGDLSVTANFSIDQHSLTYSAGEHGSIAGVVHQVVDYAGSGQPVRAVPATGYHFVSWSDGGTTASRTDSGVTADLAAKANFALNQYTLNYVAGEHGSIVGVGRQTVAHGDDGSPVTAVAQQGYHFVNWSDGGTSAERIDKNLAGGLEVKAVFAINSYRIGGNLSGLIDGTQVVLQNNGGDDLKITANGPFYFATELPNGSPYDIQVLTQPTAPNLICTVTGGAGSISVEDITEVAVACIPVTYAIGGSATGLPEGNQVIIENGAGESLTIGANGAFTFPTPLDDGSAYHISVTSQPQKPNWACSVENADGTLAGQEVNDVILDCFPEVILQTRAGLGKIKLNWNSQDFSEGIFTLCRAQEEIPGDGFNRCQELEGAVIETKVSSPLTVFELTKDTPYWFQLEAQSAGRKTLSKPVKATPFGGLNDSGIIWCANDLNNNNVSTGSKIEMNKGCEALEATFPGQDAHNGRDAAARKRQLRKIGNGAAGFDFTKICQSGQAAGEGKCPPNPMPGGERNHWACNRDNVTGLSWEIKADTGLRGKENTYPWYNPDKMLNGGGPGVKNSSKCESGGCDTQSYVQAVNAMKLCGASDWRLPTKRELLSIVDNGRVKPAIDVRYFPNTLASNYWSSSPYPDLKNSAWQVHFLYGDAGPDEKNQKNSVRLVRGRTVTFGFNNP